MSSIFSKIIAGEVPSYKIYEDERTYAFLDIDQATRGHVLVVPKVEVDKIYDLEDEDYEALMATVKKLSRHMEEVLETRILWKVIGTDVPHAHVHLLPYDPDWNSMHAQEPVELPAEEMVELQDKLALE